MNSDRRAELLEHDLAEMIATLRDSEEIVEGMSNWPDVVRIFRGKVIRCIREVNIMFEELDELTCG